MHCNWKCSKPQEGKTIVENKIQYNIPVVSTILLIANTPDPFLNFPVAYYWTPRLCFVSYHTEKPELPHDLITSSPVRLSSI